MSAMAPLPPPALEVVELSKSLNGKILFDKINFAVAAGEIVGLSGASGAGKTTLFRCVTRLSQADAGEIRLFGRDIRRLGGYQLKQARRQIGLVFQQFNLFGRLTALENVLAGRLGYMPNWRVVLRSPAAPDRRRALEALDRVGLATIAHQRADRLSGGQQQRVAIARALVQESMLIIADEPVSNLDPESAEIVLGLLCDLARRDGRAVLCSLHQPEFLGRFVDRAMRLSNGQLATIDDGPWRKTDPAPSRLPGECQAETAGTGPGHPGADNRAGDVPEPCVAPFVAAG
jgi:phosphonate transport system ATP-binding protein